VLRQTSDWSPTERLVALVIADSLDGSSGVAEIGQRLIASRSGLGRRTVQRAIDRLTGPGGVYTAESGGAEPGSERTRSRYRVRPTGATVTPVRRAPQ
jgi:hypothetical protein